MFNYPKCLPHGTNRSSGPAVCHHAYVMFKVSKARGGICAVPNAARDSRSPCYRAGNDWLSAGNYRQLAEQVNRNGLTRRFRILFLYARQGATNSLMNSRQSQAIIHGRRLQTRSETGLILRSIGIAQPSTPMNPLLRLYCGVVPVRKFQSISRRFRHFQLFRNFSRHYPVEKHLSSTQIKWEAPFLCRNPMRQILNTAQIAGKSVWLVARLSNGRSSVCFGPTPFGAFTLTLSQLDLSGL